MHLTPTQLRELTRQQAAGQPLRVPAGAPRKKRDNREWRTQAALFKWWRAAAAGFKIDPRLMFHVPNGSLLGGVAAERERRGVWMKMAGCVSGIPDIMLAVPRLNNPYTGGDDYGWSHALFLEVKTDTGKVSPEQQEIHNLLGWKGYTVKVVRSVNEGVGAITRYLT